MDMPATMAAEMALNRQNIALSVIKANADQQQAIAQILDQSARSAPVSTSRGSNFSASA